MNYRVFLTGCSILLLANIACVQNVSAGDGSQLFNEYNGKAVLEVTVLKTGDVSVRGEHQTLQELEALIQNLKAQDGSVWYAREAPATPESSETADAVIALVIKYGTPVCLSETVDFSNCRV